MFLALVPVEVVHVHLHLAQVLVGQLAELAVDEDEAEALAELKPESCLLLLATTPSATKLGVFDRLGHDSSLLLPTTEAPMHSMKPTAPHDKDSDDDEVRLRKLYQAFRQQLDDKVGRQASFAEREAAALELRNELLRRDREQD